jgi:hypothetical protein
MLQKTAQNLMAHERLFRFGIASYLLGQMSDLALITALYVILKRVNQHLALFGDPLSFRYGSGHLGRESPDLVSKALLGRLPPKSRLLRTILVGPPFASQEVEPYPARI